MPGTLLRTQRRSRAGLVKAALCLLFAGSLRLPAQRSSPPPDEEATPTVFRHPDAARYLVQGQANIVFQSHAPFHSPYDGVNSFQGRGEYKTSLLGTLFLGYQIARGKRFQTDLILDVESSGGRGLSQALGLAGFTNLDVVRNPSLGSKPYLARYQIHQVIGLDGLLGGGMAETDRTPFSLATSMPARRLELHVGRMSLPDFLDVNTVGSDSHLQFLNWTADNNGAWDYAADTRGYTDGAVAELTLDRVTARYAIAAMPTVANGIDVTLNANSAAQNMELEVRHGAADHAGKLRLLSFVNRANMGVYRDQNRKALAAGTVPDITDHGVQSTFKYGFGVNVEQQLSPNMRAFGRFGWNEGTHESYAYTEVDQTFAAGADYSLRAHRRPFDKAGLAFITNAIKRDHQTYLALGGSGFLLGDGTLHYAREDIVEGYYNLHAWRGVYYALDGQFIEHPGYNLDRGPVLVETVRMHVDF